MHSHGQLRRLRAKRDPSSCFPLSRVSFLFSLSFSPDFPPPLCMAPSVTPRPVNQHLEGEEEDFLQWARNEARQGQKGKCEFPPPPLVCSFFSWLPPTMCSLLTLFFGRPKSQRGGNYTFAVNLEAFAASGLMVTTTDHAARLLPTPLFSLSFPSTERRGQRVEKNNDDAPPTTSRNFANHSITDSQTEYNYSALLAVSGTMQARKRRCT